MVGVGGPVALPTPNMYHQTMLSQDLYESIASRHTAGVLEQLLDNQVQLGASKTRIVFPVVSGFLYDEGLYRILGKVVIITLVVRLPAITKQPAEGAQRCLLARLA